MLEQDEDLEKVLSESVSQDTIDIGNGGSIDIESLHELAMSSGSIDSEIEFLKKYKDKLPEKIITKANPWHL